LSFFIYIYIKRGLFTVLENYAGLGLATCEPGGLPLINVSFLTSCHFKCYELVTREFILMLHDDDGNSTVFFLERVPFLVMI
jgi:hypothetical protein